MEMDSIEAGLKFRTPSGIPVETTKVTVHAESHDMHVHEVAIVEGVGEGNKYLHTLDAERRALAPALWTGGWADHNVHVLVLGDDACHHQLVSGGRRPRDSALSLAVTPGSYDDGGILAVGLVGQRGIEVPGRPDVPDVSSV